MSEIAKLPDNPVVVDQNTALLTVIARAASDPTIDIEKMERLLAMQERVMAKSAESRFNEAMNAAQDEAVTVVPDAYNQQTKSRYATYSQLHRALRPVYAKHGFSVSFDTGSDAPDGMVKVLAYVSHSGGHTRTYSAILPADGKGAKGGDVMTKTHAFGAATSYGMRYLLKMIFNVAIGEDDTDGNVPEGDAPQAPPELVAAGRDASLSGIESLKQWFASLSEQQRIAVMPEMPSLKAAAKKVSNGH